MSHSKTGRYGEQNSVDLKENFLQTQKIKKVERIKVSVCIFSVCGSVLSDSAVGDP